MKFETKFETVLNALCLVKRKQSLNWTTSALTRKSIVFYAWLLSHDERQQAKITRLQAQIDTLQLDNASSEYLSNGKQEIFELFEKIRESFDGSEYQQGKKDGLRLALALLGNPGLEQFNQDGKAAREKDNEAEIVRLQAQVATLKQNIESIYEYGDETTLERIIEREAEKPKKAGMPNNENTYIYPYEGVDE
jgi:hypothetical protein